MIPSPPCPDEPRRCVRWKHGDVPVVGLIGGIGAGKSSMARLLASRGAFVIDADDVGHELLEDPTIRGQVVERFGAGVLEDAAASGREDEPRRVNRRSLGAIVFADPAALKDLEAILHPAMRKRFATAIDRVAREGRSPCIVLDAAILLEAGWDDLCDRVIFVDAPRDLRLSRLSASRGWSESVLASRERSQWPAEQKRRRADWVVMNESGPDSLGIEVDRILACLAAPRAGHASAGERRELEISARF